MPAERSFISGLDVRPKATGAIHNPKQAQFPLSPLSEPSAAQGEELSTRITGGRPCRLTATVALTESGDFGPSLGSNWRFYRGLRPRGAIRGSPHKFLKMGLDRSVERGSKWEEGVTGSSEIRISLICLIDNYL